MRIPTILGILLLVIGIGVGVYLTKERQVFFSQASVVNTPSQVTVANIDSTSASIYWQTDKESPGFITAGLTPSGLDLTFNDDRDLQTPQKHTLHFVTLKSLQADTTYHFQVVSGGVADTQTRSFTTSREVSPSNLSHLSGVVLDEKLQPVTEALVILSIPGAQSLATITKSSGNFILPLVSLKTADLALGFDLSTSKVGSLKIFNSLKNSTLEVEIPSSYEPSLPTIILGENRSLVPTKAPTPTPDPITKYDLNADKKLDDKDRQIIRSNFYRQKEDSLRVDFNGDGVVNQQDLSLFNNAAANL